MGCSLPKEVDSDAGGRIVFFFTESSLPTPSALAASREDSGSQLMMGKPINGKQVARIMRDGTKPCGAMLKGNRAVTSH